jgi:protein-disulfide isomerase
VHTTSVGAAEIVSADDLLADRVLGDEAAPVLIVEYSSLTCPHCAAFHKETLPKIIMEYIDTGKARLIFRDFPFGPRAKFASMIARCVDPERYYGFLTVLFRDQEQWAGSAQFETDLRRLSRLAGLSEADFNACWKNQALLEGIERKAAEAGKEYGIESTPSFVINGEKITGAVPFEEFKTVIDKALEKAN